MLDDLKIKKFQEECEEIRKWLSKYFDFSDKNMDSKNGANHRKIPYEDQKWPQNEFKPNVVLYGSSMSGNAKTKREYEKCVDLLEVSDIKYTNKDLSIDP
jgi:hypothetical protein